MTKRYAPVKVNPEWEPRGVVPSRDYTRIVSPMLGRPRTTLNRDGTYSHTWEMPDPFAPVPSPLPAWFRPRTIAVIEAETRRATVPGLRREDV